MWNKVGLELNFNDAPASIFISSQKRGLFYMRGYAGVQHTMRSNQEGTGMEMEIGF